MSALPLHLLPQTAALGPDGRLSLGGVDVLELAETFGTPLFVYDEAHLRARAREAVQAFPGGAYYASKAFLCGAMAQLVHGEHMGIDVASGGELALCLAAGVPAERIVLHGNNKSVEELSAALAAGVGRIVVDSTDELDRLDRLVAAGAERPAVLVRVTPGVDAHTHDYISTGREDSKFGFGLHSGAAQAAVDRLTRPDSPGRLVGLHSHIGSQVFDAASFAKAIDVLAPFVRACGLEELCVGGGIGVAYVEGELSDSITAWGERVHAACRDAGIDARVTAEPGRSIAAQAAVTLYTVGTIKHIPGVRTYVAVDGGMIDNPRPALYGSEYEAFVPRNVAGERAATVRVVGKHCESGDVLLHEARVPTDLAVGDVLATPVTGAYGMVMGSNYNRLARPAVVFVADGRARLVVRRETIADLVQTDVVLQAPPLA